MTVNTMKLFGILSNVLCIYEYSVKCSKRFSEYCIRDVTQVYRVIVYTKMNKRISI